MPLVTYFMNNNYLGILVNKAHFLPEDYAPADLVPVNIPFAYVGDDFRNYMRRPAAKALETMFRDAEAAGLHPIWPLTVKCTPPCILPNRVRVNTKPGLPWIFPPHPSNPP